MKVVSNTSPLIFLSKIKRLSLLEKCFSETFAPKAVCEEFGERLPTLIKRYEISEEGAAFVKGSMGRLHQGELEAIIATKELKANFALMDDLLARRKAERLGIKPLGTIGILLLANRMNVLSSSETKSAVRVLTEEHGLFISEVMLKTIFAEIKT